MASNSGDRTSYFPAIERKYGQPMSYWFGLMEERAGQGYPEQVAFLKEEHGFSQAHANALVMYCRGSASSRRFDTVEQFLATVDPVGAATIRRIFDVVTAARPELELVIAWNQPMVRVQGTQYVLGVSAASKHLLLGPWGEGTIAAVRDRLAGYTVNKKTVQIPLDWEVDEALLLAMVDARLAAIDS